jgi:hypothetical protein
MSPAIPKRVIIGFSLGFAILAVNALIAYQTIISLKQATRSAPRSVSSARHNAHYRQLMGRVSSGQRPMEKGGREPSLFVARNSLITSSAPDTLRLCHPP